MEVDKKRRVFAPNIFTPNGDGENDIFVIYGGEGVSKVLSLKLYNREGAEVFKKENFLPNDPNFGWDGTFRTFAQQPQVFMWVAEMQFLDGAVLQFTGDTMLLR